MTVGYNHDIPPGLKHNIQSNEEGWPQGRPLLFYRNYNDLH